jgi:C4-type Zn-finger protein
MIKEEIIKQHKQRAAEASLSKNCPDCGAIGKWRIEVKRGNIPASIYTSRGEIIVVTLTCLECHYYKHDTVERSATIQEMAAPQRCG